MAEPTQYITGLISSISWDQVIEALLGREHAYIESVQNRINENLTKLTTWGSLSARLLTLQNYSHILSRSSTFQATSATSTKEEILTATVTGAGQTGLYPLKVYQLSHTHQLISKGFQDTESEVASANDTITIEVEGGWVDKKTPLSWLNGQTGIYRGSIKITDRSGSSATIDLSGALTIEDVIDAINDNTTIKVTAEVEYDAGNKVGDALKLTDTSGGSNNFKVEEVSGGTTAGDLGILADVAAAEIHGNDINYISSSTILDFLNDRTGVNTITGDDFTITCRNGATIDVSVTNCTTVGDVLDAINNDAENSGKITASVVSNANGIRLVDNIGGGDNLFVTAIGSSTAAADLGIEKSVAFSTLDGDAIIPGLNTVLLKTLRGGLGIRSETGNDFKITCRDATEINVDISGCETVQEVINAINTAAGADITASHDREGNGLLLTDNTGGTGNLSVTALNSSYAAADLGINKSVSSDTLEGSDLNPQYIARCTKLEDLNGGQGVDANKIEITDHSGGNAEIDLSDAETIGDVIDAINGASGISVTASVNSTETTLSADYSSPNEYIEVSDPTGFAIGNQLRITNGENTEYRIITDITETNKIHFQDVLTYAYTTVNGRVQTGEGNGILLTDNSSGSSPFKVEEAGGTTARDLNILQSTTGDTIDGSFEVTVQLSSEDTTLEGIRNAINDADAQVYAAIINDGSDVNPYRLLITSERSGEVGRMIVDPEFSAGEVLELNTTTSGKNAAVVLEAEEGGSILIIDSSNQLDEVIPGVTLNLLTADPTETVHVRVEADIEAIKQSINNLIDAYNDLMNDISTQQSYDAETQQRGGPLFGNMSLMNVRNQVRGAITDPVEGSSSLTSIFDLGISPDLTGHLNVDDSKLTEVLNDDLEGVRDLFSLSENVALTSFETTASASSTYSGDYNAASVNNGDTTSDNWGNPGGGWKDNTVSEFPDYLTLTFDSMRTLSKVKIYTLDSDSQPADEYGIRDYAIQYLTRGGNPNNDDDWETYTTVTGNTNGIMTHYLFSISTEAIRLKIDDSNDDNHAPPNDKYSRIIEFEAYQSIGIGGRSKNSLSYITDANTGLVASTQDSLISQIENYEETIEAQEKLLEMKREALWRQFTEMEQYLAIMQAQSNWLYQQMSLLAALAG